MKEQTKNNKNGINGILGQLAAERKKVGIALCLIAVMGVMWVRVLTRQGPQSVQAAAMIEQTDVDEQVREAMKITYVDPPIVPGRDDVISRDFFASVNWEDFKPDGQEYYTVDIEDVNVAPVDDSKEAEAVVRRCLKLEAIGMGRNPQAFINDRLVSVGEKLAVTDGAKMYECEVVEIRESSVLIRCRDAEIVLKLVETAEGES
ncbi:MAG TPA: hypothetical protein VJJ98_04055 [Sedimentisphaerales bacterium]|nr:hypothetical protein [Sedimentisphaerales bacterium]